MDGSMRAVSQEMKNYIRFAYFKFNSEPGAQKVKTQSNYKYNTELITEREQDNIYGLYLFMSCNPQITDNVINAVISNDLYQFRILKGICKDYHGFVTCLRAYGFNSMCDSLAQARKLKNSEHKI